MPDVVGFQEGCQLKFIETFLKLFFRHYVRDVNHFGIRLFVLLLCACMKQIMRELQYKEGKQTLIENDENRKETNTL